MQLAEFERVGGGGASPILSASKARKSKILDRGVDTTGMGRSTVRRN